MSATSPREQGTTGWCRCGWCLCGWDRRGAGRGRRTRRHQDRGRQRGAAGCAPSRRSDASGRRPVVGRSGSTGPRMPPSARLEVRPHRQGRADDDCTRLPAHSGSAVARWLRCSASAWPPAWPRSSPAPGRAPEPAVSGPPRVGHASNRLLVGHVEVGGAGPADARVQLVLAGRKAGQARAWTSVRTGADGSSSRPARGHRGQLYVTASQAGPVVVTAARHGRPRGRGRRTSGQGG